MLNASGADRVGPGNYTPGRLGHPIARGKSKFMTRSPLVTAHILVHLLAERFEMPSSPAGASRGIPANGSEIIVKRPEICACFVNAFKLQCRKQRATVTNLMVAILFVFQEKIV